MFWGKNHSARKCLRHLGQGQKNGTAKGSRNGGRSRPASLKSIKHCRNKLKYSGAIRRPATATSVPPAFTICAMKSVNSVKFLNFCKLSKKRLSAFAAAYAGTNFIRHQIIEIARIQNSDSSFSAVSKRNVPTTCSNFNTTF